MSEASIAIAAGGHYGDELNPSHATQRDPVLLVLPTVRDAVKNATKIDCQRAVGRKAHHLFLGSLWGYKSRRHIFAWGIGTTGRVERRGLRVGPRRRARHPWL